MRSHVARLIGKKQIRGGLGRRLLGLCCVALVGTAPAAGMAQPDAPRPCAAAWLFVSDNPERVAASRGLLYAYTQNAACVRLLYHHQNANPSLPLALQVWLYDMDDTPAVADVVMGVGGPSPDVMGAGHNATMQFWRALTSHTSTPLTVPAHAWRLLRTTVLRPNDVVSGIAQIRIHSGGLAIVVQADLPGDARVPLGSFLLREGTHPFGAFGAPLITQHLEAPTDRARGLVLGDRGFLRDAGGHLLKGNYGVIYHVLVECVNPSPRPVWLTLAFTPLRGPSSGTFVINGALLAASPTPAGMRIPLARVHVPPGRWPLDIWTTPEGGSWYPVRLDLLPLPET